MVIEKPVPLAKKNINSKAKNIESLVQNLEKSNAPAVNSVPEPTVKSAHVNGIKKEKNLQPPASPKSLISNNHSNNKHSANNHSLENKGKIFNQP